MNSKDDSIVTDVLVLGGGLGGCFAAIKAAEAGANVVLFEKAEISRSGNGNTGLHRIPLIHPDYNFSFEEFARLNVETASGVCDEDVSFAYGKDSLDRILDLESYGLKVRKDDGSFIFMPATDICPGKPVIWGPDSTGWHDVKPLLAKKVRSFPNVEVLNRTMGVSLLTEDGSIGGKVTGAIGLKTREGRFVTCRAKAVILTTGGSYRLGRHKNSMYAPTRFIECGAPTNCGEGVAMAYRAGADLVNSELTKYSAAWKDFHHWGCGPIYELCFPFKGSDGKAIELELDQPLPFSSYIKKTMNTGFDTLGPIYFDASSLEGYPEDKGEFQKLTWALENESTSVGYFEYMKQRGEDFKKAPVEFEWHPPYIHNNQGGIYMDKDAKTSLEGLYCAGDLTGGGWRQSSGGALVFGARAGINAAEYSGKASKPVINDEQVNKEKERFIKAANVNPREGYSWIELEDKARQIASEYGPFYTSDAKLERGLYHLERIRTNYLPKLYARTPREMMRVSEVYAVFSNVECFLRAGLVRKERFDADCTIFEKTGYPIHDDTKLPYHTLIKCIDGEMNVSTKPVKRLDQKE